MCQARFGAKIKARIAHQVPYIHRISPRMNLHLNFCTAAI